MPGPAGMTHVQAEEFAAQWRRNFDAGGNSQTLANTLGISVRALQMRRGTAEAILGISLRVANTLADDAKQRLAADERLELTNLRARSAEVERLYSLFSGAIEHEPDPPPWLHKTTLAPKCLGTPTLFISDLHWGENVDPMQINGVNEYNLKIARKRLRRVFDTAITMLYEHLSPHTYPGMVVVLGGDIVSGNIHEELRDTNDATILVIVLDATDHIIAGIQMLLDAGVPHVFVPCVVGNHGRLDKKPRAKGAVQDNYEWIIYQLIARHFAGNKRVTVAPSTSLDYVYQVHNTTYLLTHGDQFKGGSGIAGPFTPWALGDHKKRKRQNAIDQPYDYMIFGHFHMLVWGTSFIVNGSLKGYDEYAFRSNFGFEPPQQALWITHPKHGITVKMEIGAEDRTGGSEATPWVRVRGG